MDRQVVEALQAAARSNRFMKGLFDWVGFRQVGVPYVRPARRRRDVWGYRSSSASPSTAHAFTTRSAPGLDPVGIGAAVLALSPGSA